MSQNGKFVVVVFYVLVEAKEGQNQTQTVFEPKKLKQAIAKSKDTFSAKFGVPIASLDGKAPQAIIDENKSNPPPKESNAVATAGIVIAVILVVLVIVVIIYLYV